MIEHHLRQQYQRILVNPLASILKNRITANQITLLSGFLGLLVLPALILHHIVLGITLLLLSGFCDTLDGTLARLNQNSSDWGSVMDIMSDRFVEFVVVFALFTLAPQQRGVWTLLMLGSMFLCITSFLVVGIFTVNDSQKSFHYSPGLMERAEAFLFFIAMILWPNAFVVFSLLFTGLVTLTAVIRLAQFHTMQQATLIVVKENNNEMRS
ncbi:cytochrome C oxidase subunit III [Legionella pneumophila str. Leg01/11]|nr:cytochrome C oxidase subunit III [Legionella pneumophila str. Leg01/11]